MAMMKDGKWKERMKMKRRERRKDDKFGDGKRKEVKE